MCFHKWTKWVSEEKLLKKYFDNDYDYPIEQYLIQRKSCEKCGKEKIRKERV